MHAIYVYMFKLTWQNLSEEKKRISLCFEFMNVLTADAMHVRLMRKTQHYQVSELSFYEKAQKSTVQQKAHLGNITHSTKLTS